MRTYKLIATANPNAASNTSLTSAVPIPTEFDEYAILIQANYAITNVCAGVRVLVGETATGTFYDVCYSNSPNTTTSGLATQLWAAPSSASISGAMVPCEALRFCPGYAKFQFLATCTANTGGAIKVFGRQGD